MSEFKKGDRVLVTNNTGEVWYKRTYLDMSGTYYNTICDQNSYGSWGFCKLDPDHHTLDTPKHYDNSKGTLYKVAVERGWNAYLFDIVKRLERSEKKGEFESDLNKSIKVIELWKEESIKKP